MSSRVENLEKSDRELSERLAHSSITTVQQRLAGRIRRMTFFGFFIPLLAPMLFFVVKTPLWVCCIYALFGVVMAVVNLLLAGYISKVDLLSLPVVEATMRALKIRRYQTYIRIFGAFGGAGVLLALMWPWIAQKDTVLLISCAVGMAIGLAVSLPRAIKNHRLAKKLVDEIKI